MPFLASATDCSIRSAELKALAAAPALQRAGADSRFRDMRRDDPARDKRVVNGGLARQIDAG
jgi:hypothetical protein